MTTMRLDAALIALGYASSRARAKEILAAGSVTVDGRPAGKASMSVDPTVQVIHSDAEDMPYVSRGGLKLARAMETWPIDLAGLRCLDIGASTGGFTDCMLQGEAEHVWAVDVGHDQLHPNLVADKRVTNLEGTNIRDLSLDLIGGKEAGFASVDVSFISLRFVLPVLWELIEPRGHVVCLVKPQFEAGRERVGKGIVRDPAIHRDVLAEVCSFASQLGWVILGLDRSPIKGPEGNIEYLMYLGHDQGEAGITPEALPDVISQVVWEAHQALGK